MGGTVPKGGGRGRSCLIAPIGVGGGGNCLSPLPFVGTLLQMQLASQLKPPLFDEQSDSWADFVWEWEEYWRSLTDGGGTVSEGDKLKVFGQCLGRDLQDTITYLKRSSGAVAFEHVFTYFEQKYGQRKVLGIQAA